MKKSFYSFTVESLEKYLTELGENPFKARLMFNAVYKEHIDSFSKLQLKASLCEHFEENFSLELPECVEKLNDNKTIKLLFKLYDGEFTEAVIMRQYYGNSVCISTEVGCAMGCKFCRSGSAGRVRALGTHEIVGQLMYIRSVLGEQIDNITVMGIGEPFMNYDNLMDALDIVKTYHGMTIGPRHITVSTCGIVPKIYEFADSGKAVPLAVSLHAPYDALRSSIMPIADKYTIAELCDAMKYYIEKTGYKILVEYILLDGINDSVDCARTLVELLKDIRVTVNLIPYNYSGIEGFKRSSQQAIDSFFVTLKEAGLSATTRKEFGTKMLAACGQLRAARL